MNARRLAGVTALNAGLLLVFAIAGSAMSGPTGFLSSDPTSWRMGPGMMGSGRIEPGMMDHGSVGPVATAIPGATEIRVQAASFGFTPKRSGCRREPT